MKGRYSKSTLGSDWMMPGYKAREDGKLDKVKAGRRASKFEENSRADFVRIGVRLKEGYNNKSGRN